jgi:hypothetical protein
LVGMEFIGPYTHKRVFVILQAKKYLTKTNDSFFYTPVPEESVDSRSNHHVLVPLSSTKQSYKKTKKFTR